MLEEDEQIIKAAKALGLNEVVPEIYRDMLQPAAREVGDGLATIAKAVKVSLAPLEVGIWGYEQIKDWLSIRVTSILAERKTTNIQNPPLSIAGPLVFQLIFAKDEAELKDLYASLLSSAMDSNDSSAHPSFVAIIQQLTSDEAKILRHIAQINNKWPSLSEHEASEGFARESVSIQFIEWCKQSDVVHLNKSDAYMDNLIRLRILHQVIGNDSKYDLGEGHYFGPSISNTEYEFVELTAFGRLFLNACIEKRSKSKTSHEK